MKPALSIRTLLFVGLTSVWLLPLASFAALRVYDVYLLRQTEHQLIAESVMVREIYRAALLEADGRTDEADGPRAQETTAARSSERYSPIDAYIDFDTPVLPPQAAPVRTRSEEIGRAHV